MLPDLLDRARAWLRDDPDPLTVAEMQGLVDRAELPEIAERMAGPLLFGTAGLRGVMGAGESRMNRAVIRRTTAGLGRFLLGEAEVGERAVAIGYDGRQHSRIFAEDAAGVLAALGVRVHLFAVLCPTPLLAFAVTALGAVAGVMVTASHNPPEYNGYKVYGGDGAQILPPRDERIASLVAALGAARDIPVMDLTLARSRGLVLDVPAVITERYLDSVARLSLDPRGRGLLRVVYTPLHGTGDELAHAALARFGVTHVRSVPAQREPDGRFPTVAFPNPEEPGALDLAFALGKQEGATLILANDPDADRLSVAIPDGAGGFRQLTGNEVGVLLGEYLLRRGGGGAERLVVSTIVSSPMLGHIAGALGVRHAEVLTGFKWIAGAALRLEASEGLRFVFGYEEALGYAAGTAVRDKDGISAAALFAELTAVAASEGRDVEDELERLAREYGLFVSTQRNLTRKGQTGAAEISAIMADLRGRDLRAIGGLAVVAVRDLKSGTRREGASRQPLDLPRSDVLLLDLERGARVVARPSGTEPKIKFYFDLRETVLPGEPFSEAKARAGARLGGLVDAFLALVILRLRRAAPPASGARAARPSRPWAILTLMKAAP